MWPAIAPSVGSIRVRVAGAFGAAGAEAAGAAGAALVVAAGGVEFWPHAAAAIITIAAKKRRKLIQTFYMTQTWRSGTAARQLEPQPAEDHEEDRAGHGQRQLP